MVVGAVTHVLLYFVYDLKITKMHIQCSLIQKLMFYEFKMGYNTTEATKNICYVKGEGAVDHNTETR